jgi:hypothetical protein
MISDFESHLPIIEKEILKRKNKVHLYINDADFDDLSQIIKIHLFRKWHLRDESRPVINWINRIISNQITNYIRNNYSHLAPPCIKCVSNQGGGLCSYTSSGTQCSECPLYKKWESKKRDGYNIKFASSLNEKIEDSDEEVISKICIESEGINWEDSFNKISNTLKEKLPDDLFFAYKFLFVDGKSEKELGKALGFRTSENNRNPGYKQIYNIKQKIINEVKQIIKNGDIL